MKTQSQAVSYIKSTIGKGIDFDKEYGYQCMDLAVDYMYYITDGKVRMWGNAKDAINNDFKGLATVHKNTPKFLPKPGDIAVDVSGEYGHIQNVLSADLNQYTVVEQNWLGGGASFTEVATKRTHSYGNNLYFIRPKFAKGKPVKETGKKPTSKKLPKPWKENKYGTIYKTEKATFYNGNEPIQTRIDSPKMKAPKGYKFQPNGYTPYDEVCLSDKHVWIGYNWKGKRYYLPIREWDGVAPPKHGLGSLWGVIK